MKHFDSVITGPGKVGKALSKAPVPNSGDNRAFTHPRMSGALDGLFAL